MQRNKADANGRSIKWQGDIVQLRGIFGQNLPTRYGITTHVRSLDLEVSVERCYANCGEAMFVGLD